jgi:hypothetical protein
MEGKVRTVEQDKVILVPARDRLIAGAAVAALALAPFAALPAAAGAAKHRKAPKAGAHYAGHTGDGGEFTLDVADKKTVKIVAFQFDCGNVTGRTSLQDIPIKKTKKGYKFRIEAYGIVTYSDEKQDENGKIDVSGKFSKGAKQVTGQLRVRPPRCHDTGKIHWTAHRKSTQN